MSLTRVPFVGTSANVCRVVSADEPQMFLDRGRLTHWFRDDARHGIRWRGHLYVLQHATGAVERTGAGVLIHVTPDKGQSGICAW